MFKKQGKAATGVIMELGVIKSTDTIEHTKKISASDISWKKPKESKDGKDSKNR